jgi:phage terminase small subunit
MDSAMSGPKMLTEKQRAFVVHFVETGGDNATESARAAGYADNGGSGIRVAATRLKADPRVLAAIREVTEQQLGIDLPKARAALPRDRSQPGAPGAFPRREASQRLWRRCDGA